MMHPGLRRLFLSGVIALSSGSVDASQNGNPNTMVAIEPSKQPLFAWVKRGQLFWGESAKQHAGKYFFRRPSEKTVIEIDSVEQLAVVIRDQAMARNDTVELLRTKVADLAVSFLASSNTYIITKTYIKNRISVSSFAWGNQYSPKEIAHSLEVLKRYESDLEPTMENNFWGGDFYTTTGTGAVERWTMKGTIEPFTITDFNRARCEKSGTVIPLPEFR